jgi:hypothetical protein
VFLIQWWKAEGFSADVLGLLEPVQEALFWLMVAATVGSGVQYLVKGHRMLKTVSAPPT